MGTFENIRKISPYAFLIFGIMLVLFFTIGDPTVIDGITGSAGGGPDRPVGTVNEKDISYVEYETRIKEQVEQQRNQAQQSQQPVNEKAIRTQIWQQMIEEILISQKTDELGLTVTDEQIADILIDNPPQFLKQNFTDTSGQFNRQMYLELITNPETYGTYLPEGTPPADRQAAVESFRNDLMLIEDYLKKSKLAEYLQSVVNTSGSIISPKFAKLKYKAENSYADFSYIAFKASSIVDETKVEVSEEEIREYYNKYKSILTQPEQRKVKYLQIPVQPSADDSAKVKRRVKLMIDNIRDNKGTPALDSIFDLRMSEWGGETYDFQNVEEMDKQKYSYMALAPIGDVIGPVQLRDGTYFFRVDGKREGDNIMVKASHILVNFGDNKDSAMTEANKILRRAKGNEDFAELAKELSQDKGSGARGGDLGYFGKGMMVPPFEEAAFAANEGEIVGPVESRFGYHIIKVIDKSRDELSFSEIKLDPNISGITKNKLFMEAKSIVKQVKEGKSLDTLGSKLGYKVTETSFFDANRPVLGSKYLSNLAFNAELNEVLPVDEIGNNGIIVAQVTGQKAKGIQSFDDAKEDIRKKLAKEKQVDLMKDRAMETYNRVKQYSSLKEAQEADPSLDVKSVTNVNGTGSVTGLGKDVKLVNQIFASEEGKILAPIKGDMGYFIVSISSLTVPSQETLDKAFKNFANKLREEAKGSAFMQWYKEYTESSDIKDLRSNFYKEF